MDKSPESFSPALTESRLRLVAETLLDVHYDTEAEMDTPLDDGYTKGTAAFGRQRNALIRLCNDPQYLWLKLTNSAMDMTFEIGSIPCRFFADDPLNPRKRGFFRRNDADQLFELEVGAPVLFRFVVAKPQYADDEADVFFIGFDANQDEVFRWQYSRSTPSLSSVSDSRPSEVPLPQPAAKVRTSSHGQDGNLGAEADGDESVAG